MFKRLLKLWFVPVSVHAKLIEDYKHTLDVVTQLQQEREKLSNAVLLLHEKLKHSRELRTQERAGFTAEMTAARNTMAMAVEVFEKQKDRFRKLSDAVEKSADIPVSRPDSIRLEEDDAVKQAIAELAARGPAKLN